MLITLSFDKFASHFCRTLKLRVMNQNSGVGNSRSFSFQSVLFRNKSLMLDEMTQRNTTKFAIFSEYENQCSFFFSFHATLCFSLMNALLPWSMSTQTRATQTRAFIRKKVKFPEMKNEKNYMGFLITIIWQLLKCFSRTFH